MITKPFLVTSSLVALLGSCAFASAPSKTITPERVRANLLDQAPYRYNGVILSGDSRGSAFRAWHPQTIFTAAHVLYQNGAWTDPPA